jgi:hypothetical protein
MSRNAAYRLPNATVPAFSAANVTPDNSGALRCTRALFIGTGGSVTVDMAVEGDSITFANVPSGTTLPIQVVRVYLTGTSAADIVALY